MFISQDESEEIKGIIRSRKLKKDRQYNGQRKGTNNDIQITTQETKNLEEHEHTKIFGLNSAALKDKEFLLY